MRAAGAAEGDCMAGTRSVEQDGAWRRACARLMWIAPVRGGVRWLAEQKRRLQAARRTSDLGSEPPAYAARMSRRGSVRYGDNGNSPQGRGWERLVGTR